MQQKLHLNACAAWLVLCACGRALHGFRDVGDDGDDDGR
jgi:hypothetical protein